MIALVLILVFGIALTAGPIVSTNLGHDLGTATSMLMTGSGIVISILSIILMVISKLYQRTSANEAFVRTGMGGMKVIKDGGSIVVPVVHQLMRVPLESMRLEMERIGAAGLITGDKLRADIKAEFFIRVQPLDDDILNAARSLGERLSKPEEIKKLVEDKLVSALRNAAAKKTLEELNSNRDSFMGEVVALVTTDLKHNGLTLEAVTISKLDQADPKTLNENNIFDAQGLKTITETVQASKTTRNKLEREGEFARTQQDVQTRQQVLALEQTKAEAEAAQKSEIAKIQALREQETQQKQIEANRTVELANIEKSKTLEVAEREKQQAMEVAERAKQQAMTAADQKVEVAQRAKEQAVAVAEAERAKAVATQAAAEAEAEKARQSIETAKVQATAEREKARKVIEAEAAGQTNLISKQREADASAYAVQKDAEARKLAADADAAAITKKAEAEATAKQRQAEGDRAIAMVPVDVQKAAVDVKQREVDVLKQELEARAANGEVAQNFEIAKLRITKEAEVRIASAGAMAELMGSIDAKVFGTQEDVAKMVNRFMQGMGLANTVEGFLSNTGPATGAGIDQMIGMIKSLAEKAGVSPEVIASAEKVIEASGAAKTAKGGENGKSAD